MSQVLRFDCFEVDLAAGHLFKRGIRIGLRDQPFQVLAALLERPGQVVTRDDLRRRLWPAEVFVDFENSLNIAVTRLRTALGDSAEHPRFVETLPRRGYRFIGDVSPPAPGVTEGPKQRLKLVVLPFVNLSGNPAHEYFCDALTDEIITALTSVAPEQMVVIARASAMHYRGSRMDLSRVVSELGVDYVVEGALHDAERQVAVNVQLVQASDKTHLFARRYRRELSDVFQMYDSIVQDITKHVSAIAGKAQRGPAAKKPTENPAAYDEYIQGRHEMWKWTPEGVAKANRHFEAALARDPNFALACDGLANLYGYLGFWGFLPPDEAEPLRRFYGLRAVELDSTLAEPRTHVAYRPLKLRYEDAYSYNWLEAERLMASARDLNPNSPLIRVRHATVLMVLGKTGQAIAELECALESDPLSPEVRFWLVEALLFDRQYERGLDQAKLGTELEPGFHIAHMVLGQVYLGMQRFEESVAALRRAAEMSNDLPLMLGWLGLALGLGGQTTAATMVLERIRAISSQRFVLPTSFAWVHLGLGEIDDAFAWMERAVDRNDEWVHPLRVYPFLDPLRADRRFHALLRKLNLET
ncbi:MAG: winged helix-turn-helix domain-containing protein [Bryobacteraceae bacterium]